MSQGEAEIGSGFRLGIGLGMQRGGWGDCTGVCGVDCENAGCVPFGVDEHFGCKAALVAVVIHVAVAVEIQYKKTEAHHWRVFRVWGSGFTRLRDGQDALPGFFQGAAFEDNVIDGILRFADQEAEILFHVGNGSFEAAVGGSDSGIEVERLLGELIARAQITG